MAATSDEALVLPRLFAPLSLRGVTLPNRIVSTAHSTGLSEGERIGARLIAYYEARARGGVGLIIMGSTSVHPSSTSRLMPALANWDDGVIEPYRRLAAAVHRHGTAIFAQLNHAGAQSGNGGGTSRLLAPSPFDSELGVETPHALAPDEVREIVDAFASAAVRARSGGLDGVELHAGHGNLIQQFLSPVTNWRSDDYGGNAEKRLRFARDVVSAVRAALGPDFVVGIRISVQEDEPGGLTLADMRSVVPELVTAGDLDYVSVTSGTDSSSWSLVHHYAPMYIPRQHMRGLARSIRSTVSVPVLAVGRIVDPREAEEILAAGDADLVGMTRALIADRDLPMKARLGEFDRIRTCVGINEGCIGRLMRGLPITCVQDPTNGRELDLGTLTPAAVPRHVVVAGAGVAGLEAARVAALRGHRVTLLERLSEPGGQVQLASRAPERAELGSIVDHLVSAVRNLGIEIRFGIAATAAEVLALRPDVVVVATGSEPRPPTLADEGGCTISARAVLAGARVADRVIVFDTKGDMVGLTVADWLLARGHAVTVVTTQRYPGPFIEPITRRILHQRLLDAGCEFVVDTEAVGMSEEGIAVRHLISGRRSVLRGSSVVVAACGAVANDGLYHELRRSAAGLAIHLVGDAAAPRQIEQAIYEGHMAARAL